MNRSIVALGVLILVVGVGVFAYGDLSPLSTTSSQSVTKTVAIPTISGQPMAAKGTWATGSVQLTQGTHVTGTFSDSNYSSSDGPLFFYIQDKPTFVTWGNCSPCKVSGAYNQTATSTGTASIDWTVPANGSYFFIFDGESYKSGASLGLTGSGTLSTTEPVTTSSLNTTPIYLGAVLAIVGILLAAASFVSAGGKKMPPAGPAPSG